MRRLAAAPVSDVNGSDELAVPCSVVALHKSKRDGTTTTEIVLIKSGMHGDYVCFYESAWQ